MTTKKFRLIFYIAFGICLLVAIAGLLSFRISEHSKASGWVLQYCLVPIVVIMAVVNYFAWCKFLCKEEKKEYRPIGRNRLRSFLTISVLTLGLTALLYTTILSSILLTNAFFADGNAIKLNATIREYKLSKSGRTRSHNIIIEDDRFPGPVELRVSQAYKEGDQFNEEVSIGRWGLLYSWK